jgi:hypothetical protein
MNLKRAVTAGLIGGVVVDLFLILIRVAPFPGIYQFIASTVVGPVAFSSSAYIALGVVMHFVISIIFALAYAFIAQRSPVLLEHPIRWGAIFGVAVMLVMQVVTGVAHASQPPTVQGIVIGLIAHVVFFGLPVAWYIARPDKPQTAAAGLVPHS